MLLKTTKATKKCGIHARIMPPERWQRMSTAKKQKAIRGSTLNKVSGIMHIPQSTLRESYLGTVSMLVEHDPVLYAREMTFDADQLNFFLNDRARAQSIIKTLALEEKEKEKEKEPKEKKPKKEKAPKQGSLPEAPAPVPEPVRPAEPPTPAAPAEPAEVPEKKIPAKTQSTLFDGF